MELLTFLGLSLTVPKDRVTQRHQKYVNMKERKQQDQFTL